MPLRVLIADDHQMVREGLRILIEREGMEIVGEAADGWEAVHLANTYSPDVAVFDLCMPLLNGLDAAREILHRSPRTAIVLLTGYSEEYQIVGALRAGIRGYVVKTQAAEELVRAIREVAAGGTYLSPSVSRVVVDAYLTGKELPADPLTPRERQVLQLVAEGKTSKEIAVLLGLTVKTAESYRAELMEKLNIHETAGLVRYAIRSGLIHPIAVCSSFLEDSLSLAFDCGEALAVVIDLVPGYL
jgi:DNA-binding NarL/FixJ family response regulator